ncbi:MAG: glycosyltransferase family 2 protein [Microbacteriaceae bacterium]|jgi:N-acetylglucosaminyl-diphospho-decaprenol L-rhamnosyltransferase|nr:glycosyltransferase family 2 protein [Microbacteriaceae bacterium]
MTERSFGAEVACITVSYHSADALRELIASLRESVATVAQVHIVNNAVDDDLNEMRSLPGVEVIDAGGNLGYGGAVNLAASRLDDSIGWILVANPDAALHPDTIDTLLSVAAASPRAGALGPRLLDDTGAVYPSARELPALRTGIGHALLANSWPSNPWSRRYRGENRVTTDASRETGWLSGALLLVRREAFEAVGGFDDAFFMYFEDVDLGRRLASAGWSSLYVTSATALHHGAHSTRRAAAAMNRAHHMSAYTYLARRYSAPWLWPLRVALRVALATRERITRHRPL